MTILLVIATVLISILCFNSREWFDKLLFNPYKVYHKKEYFRFITHAFVHADWIHLIFNMFVLFSFGYGLESYFGMIKNAGLIRFPVPVYFLTLYFTALIVSSLTTLKKYRDSEFYNSVGASGAVSAVVFACIFFNPWQKLYFMAFLPIPGIIFGVLYLWYSQYMSKRSHDNINHDAHFLGALYGMTFPVLLNPSLFYVFINQLTHPKL